MPNRSATTLFPEMSEVSGATANSATAAPLADRMRPRTLEEFVGQEQLVGEGRVLRRLIESRGTLPSLILWGPPGTGKTTLARLLAHQSDAKFVALSAVFSGVKELRAAIAEARLNRLRNHRTILFIDEIHRFNKAQQDALLPAVEDGTVVMIGATTENPSFEVISALLSRSRVLVLNPLDESEIETIVRRALADEERGLASFRPDLPDDVNASLYWLARMIEGGADPVFIVRRLCILASEDIGLADPNAMVQAAAAAEIVQLIGMPEGLFPLTQATIYLARAPKSNAVLRAYSAANKDAVETAREPVPLHLRNAVTPLMKHLGYGKEYRYVHSDAAAKEEMSCLPEKLKGSVYFEDDRTTAGREKKKE